MRNDSALNSLNDRQSELRTGNLFEGEVLSAVLGPFVSMGCLSLQALALCNFDEAVRKDWHLRLASIFGGGSCSNDSIHLIAASQWKYSYRYWRGYIQREARMVIPVEPVGSKKPKIFLVHGFGGSIDQYTGLAQELASSFDVYALDSLGFGHSEKPPLSYNQ
jgi:hypothetical protein